jgi:catechol 2,3-dioxygenase-like lactoylglutathione lyase family enzyme
MTMSTPLNPIQLSVISLWADDVPTAAHFYRDVLGLVLLPHHGGRPHFDLGGMYLTILQGHPLPAQNPVPARFPLVAFSVGDLDGMVERLRDQRVSLPWGVETDGQARWVMFNDPAGNLIELVQYT